MWQRDDLAIFRGLRLSARDSVRLSAREPSGHKHHASQSRHSIKRAFAKISQASCRLMPAGGLELL
jgi:hypothetical protein